MNINEFMKTNEYLDFIRKNPGSGGLRIRAYTASEALPVSGLNIIVSSVISGIRVIFYRGITDTSGMINSIKLPAPKLTNNLEIPSTTTYDIEAFIGNNKSNFSVNMYDGIFVVQNINFVPGDNYGN